MAKVYYSNKSNSKDHEVDVGELINLLLRNYRIILFLGFILGGSIAVYSFFLEDIYESRAVLMPDVRDDPLKGASLGGLSQAFPAFLVKDRGDIDKYEQIFKSHTFLRNVVEENDLVSLLKSGVADSKSKSSVFYKKEKEALIQALEELIEKESEKGAFKISYRNSDPMVAYAVINGLMRGLSDFIESNNVTQAKATEQFIKERLEEARKDLVEVENELLTVQKTKGIVELEAQSDFAWTTASSLKSKIIEKDLEIDRTKRLMRGSARLKILQEEKTELEQALRRVMEGGQKQSDPFLTPLEALPNLGARLNSLQRNYFSKIKLAELLQNEYELAKIETKRQGMFFQVIESPMPGILPVGPKRLRNTFLGFVAGSFIGMIFVIIGYNFSNAKPIRRFIRRPKLQFENTVEARVRKAP